MRVEGSLMVRGMHGVLLIVAGLLCGACERSSTPPTVDTTGFQIVVPSANGEYAVCAKWAKGVPRWGVPQTFELRGTAGTLWSRTLSPGLYAAAVTDEGMFMGCFAPGEIPDMRDPAQLVLIDRAGAVLQNIDLKNVSRRTSRQASVMNHFALRPDTSEVWALVTTFDRENGGYKDTTIVRCSANQGGRDTILTMPDDLARCPCLQVVHVPGSDAAAVVCFDRTPFGEVVIDVRYDLSVAIFDIESGDCLGETQFATGVDQAELHRIGQDMEGIWGIRSGLCVQIDGRDSDDEPVYAMIRIVEEEGAGKIETEYVGPRAEALVERTALPVVRWIPE